MNRYHSFSRLGQRPYAYMLSSIECPLLVSLIRQYDETGSTALLRHLEEWVNPPRPGGGHPLKEPVPLRSLYIPYTKPWLNDEADIASYLQALEKVLRAEIEKGKKIQI